MVKKYFALVTFLLLALLLAAPVKGELVQLGIPAGQELIKDDPQAQKVYNSFKTYADNVRAYHKISEQAYINARDL